MHTLCKLLFAEKLQELNGLVAKQNSVTPSEHELW